MELGVVISLVIALVSLAVSYFSFQTSGRALSASSNTARYLPIRQSVLSVFNHACESIRCTGLEAKAASKLAVRGFEDVEAAMDDFLEVGCVLTDRELGDTLTNFRAIAGSEDLASLAPNSDDAAEMIQNLKVSRTALMRRVKVISKKLPKDFA